MNVTQKSLSPCGDAILCLYPPQGYQQLRLNPLEPAITD